jgi:hypothetical protein
MHQKIVSRTVAAALAIGVGVTLGWGTFGANVFGSDSPKYTEGSESQAAAKDDASGSYLSVEDVVARVKEQKYTEIREVEREGSKYEVKARNAKGQWAEVYVDAKTGEILRLEYDD